MIEPSVLRDPCRQCGHREAEFDGLCSLCFDEMRPMEGPLPAWVGEWWRVNGARVDAEHAAWKHAHALPLLPARNFGELFVDFEELPRAQGPDVYDREGHGPIEMPYGKVSRYCSLSVRGRHTALAVLPDRDVLAAIGTDPLLLAPLAKGEGIYWSILTDPLVGAHAPNAEVHYFYRGAVAQRFLALIKTHTIPGVLHDNRAAVNR